MKPVVSFTLLMLLTFCCCDVTSIHRQQKILAKSHRSSFFLLVFRHKWLSPSVSVYDDENFHQKILAVEWTLLFSWLVQQIWNIHSMTKNFVLLTSFWIWAMSFFVKFFNLMDNGILWMKKNLCETVSKNILFVDDCFDSTHTTLNDR